MRLAPFALVALFALPACEPYGYGYGGTYGGPVYGSPSYYPAPAYVAPPEGVVVFDRDDRRRYDRREYDRGRDDRGDDRRGRREDVQRGQPFVRTAPPPRGPSPFAGPPGGGGGDPRRGDRGHAPDFNPADPTAHGGADR